MGKGVESYGEGPEVLGALHLQDMCIAPWAISAAPQIYIEAAVQWEPLVWSDRTGPSGKCGEGAVGL